MTEKNDVSCGNCAHFTYGHGDAGEAGFCNELKKTMKKHETCGLFFVTSEQVEWRREYEKMQEEKDRGVGAVALEDLPEPDDAAERSAFWAMQERERKADDDFFALIKRLISEEAARREHRRWFLRQLSEPGSGFLRSDSGHSDATRALLHDARRILFEINSLGFRDLILTALESPYVESALAGASPAEVSRLAGNVSTQPTKPTPTPISPEEAAAIAGPIVGKGRFENGKWIQDPDLPPPDVVILSEMCNQGPAGRMAASVSMGVRVSEDTCSLCEEGKKQARNAKYNFALTFIVNGEDVVVETNSDATIFDAMRLALAASENSSRPEQDWEVRDHRGVLLAPNSNLGDHFMHDDRLWLSLKVGVGGEKPNPNPDLDSSCGD